MKYRVKLTLSVIVDVKDPDVINRCVNDTNGWRSHLYNLRTRDEVLEHLACNFTNARCANELDGWADLPNEACTFEDEAGSWELGEVEEIAA